MTGQNKINFKRPYEEVFNQGNLDIAEELIGTKVVEHQQQPGVTPDAAGPELVKQIAWFYRSAFPDLRIAARFPISGTHQGELMGIPPTGKRVEVRSIWLEYLHKRSAEASRQEKVNLAVRYISLSQQKSMTIRAGQAV